MICQLLHNHEVTDQKDLLRAEWFLGIPVIEEDPEDDEPEPVDLVEQEAEVEAFFAGLGIKPHKLGEAPAQAQPSPAMSPSKPPVASAPNPRPSHGPLRIGPPLPAPPHGARHFPPMPTRRPGGR